MLAAPRLVPEARPSYLEVSSAMIFAPPVTQVNPGRPMCRHCGLHPASRPKGLCRSHYYDSEIRDLYETESPQGRRGHAATGGRNILPDQPTNILPGPRKVPILEARAASRVSLFHPGDAGMAEAFLAIHSRTGIFRCHLQGV